MNRVIKQISLKERIFRSSFLLSLGSLLIFSFLSFFLIKDVVERNNNVQNETIARLFTEIITQDILVGAHHEILKKCQNAISKESISALEVRLLNGETICKINLNNTSDHAVIHKAVFFDPDGNEKAADIKFHFSQTALANLFSIYQYLILIFTALIVFGVYYFSKWISSNISAPLKELNEYMAMNALNSKILVGASNSKLEISEFNELKIRFQGLMNEIGQYQTQLVIAASREAVSKVATQAAHDIRSPLEMLKSTRDEISQLPEDSRRRIQLSINRMEEITFNLLKTHKQISGIESHFVSEELLSLTTSVITEKNIEYRNTSQFVIVEIFNSNSYGLFSKIQRSALKSIISNIINNAVESFNNDSGLITISLVSINQRNVIKIVDNGPGIPPDVKSKIFTKGFTTKKNGNGIGLFNAKQDLEAVGGTIEFESEIGKGTTFTISLPKSEAPKSFIGSIDAYKYERIIVLDDDPAFHEVWNKRLEGLESKVEHIHSVEEMFSKYQTLHPKILLLSDFELMDKHLDGIDTILKLNHAEHSVLVTARNEEQAIQDRCLAAGIKLLPKSLVNYVMVRMTGMPKITGREGIGDGLEMIKGLSESSKHIDASKLGSAGEKYGLFIQGGQAGSGTQTPIILIDDDKLVHLNWKSHCKKSGLEFSGFMSINDFMAASSSFDKASRIYIDSNLGDGIKGEIESEKIFSLGFLNLYLATGYEKDSIQKPSWIKEIYSKSPENIG